MTAEDVDNFIAQAQLSHEKSKERIRNIMDPNMVENGYVENQMDPVELVEGRL